MHFPPFAISAEEVQDTSEAGQNPIIAPLSALKVSLELAGLVALAEITVVGKWTALAGGASILDSFVLCPGLHRQHDCTSLNGGEYPATAALTTGHVFRVENQGTVFFLQSVSRTGQLTTLKVRSLHPEKDDVSSAEAGQVAEASEADDAGTVANPNEGKSAWTLLFTPPLAQLSTLSVLAYSLCVVLTVAILILMGLAEDWWGIFVVSVLIFCRAIMSYFVARRSNPKSMWFGASEPGVEGDLIILLSQDRWVGLRGLVNDLKAVTSGQWLRDLRRWENFIVSFATVLVYVTAALASNLTTLGKILLIALLVGTAGLLGLAVESTDEMIMHSRIIELDGERKPYRRRLILAEELIEQSGRHDWAVQTGMITEKDLQRILQKIEAKRRAGANGDVGNAPNSFSAGQAKGTAAHMEQPTTAPTRVTM